MGNIRDGEREGRENDVQRRETYAPATKPNLRESKRESSATVILTPEPATHRIANWKKTERQLRQQDLMGEYVLLLLLQLRLLRTCRWRPSVHSCEDPRKIEHCEAKDRDGAPDRSRGVEEPEVVRKSVGYNATEER